MHHKWHIKDFGTQHFSFSYFLIFLSFFFFPFFASFGLFNIYLKRRFVLAFVFVLA